MILSVAELILNSQKTRKSGHFLSNLAGQKCKNIHIIFAPDSHFRVKVKLPVSCTFSTVHRTRGCYAFHLWDEFLNWTHPKIMEKEKNKPFKVKEHHEEREEQAVTIQKGEDSTTSWQRVMKVTKRTEKTSKTEQQTKTYKIVGSGDQKQMIEVAFHTIFSITLMKDFRTKFVETKIR